MDSVLGMGLLLYLPRSWLSESFQQVIRRNLLGEAGLNKNDWDCPLILALIDLDGLESRKLGGQLLSSFRDAESMETKLDFENHLDNNDTAVEVGKLFISDYIMNINPLPAMLSYLNLHPLELGLTTVTHNFTWGKIIHICLI